MTYDGLGICLAFLVDLQFCILFDFFLVKFCVEVQCGQICFFGQDSPLHFELFLQFSDKVSAVYSPIGGDLLGPSGVVFLYFDADDGLCLSFGDEVDGIKGGPVRLRQLWVLNLCLLRAFLGGCQFFLLRIKFLLRFGFGLGVGDLWFLCDVVEIKELLARLGLAAEDLPQRLLFLELLGVDFCLFHTN